MKKVSEKRKSLKRRLEALTNTSRKFRLWGIVIVLIGIGIYLGGYVVGSFLYWVGFGLLLFSLVADFIAWRLKRRFRGT